MYAIVKHPASSGFVRIIIDDKQQLERVKSWLAPEASYTLAIVDSTQLMEAFGAYSEDKYRTDRIYVEPIFSYEGFWLRCIGDEDFKSTWAPHLDEQ